MMGKDTIDGGRRGMYNWGQRLWEHFGYRGLLFNVYKRTGKPAVANIEFWVVAQLSTVVSALILNMQWVFLNVEHYS